jgi:transglutaminase-like putative cysteine protease
MSASAVVKSADYHNWAEVLLDGRWQVVDAQKGVLKQRQTDYVVTRIVSRQGSDSEHTFFHRYASSSSDLVVEMD